MTNYYVDGGVTTPGNDGGAGGIATPWRTILKGIATVVAGDTIFIRGYAASTGNYLHYKEEIDDAARTIHSGSSGSPITVQAYPGELVALDAWYQGCITIQYATWMVWKDFVLDARNGAIWDPVFTRQCCALQLFRPHSDDGNLRFENMLCIGSGGTVVRGTGFYGGKKTTFKNIEVYGFSSHGVYCDESDCIYDGMNIHDNGITGGSVGLGGADPGHGIQVYFGPAQPPDCVIRNSRIHHNRVSGIQMEGARTRVENNLIYNNGYTGIEVRGDDNQEIYNNTCYANNGLGINLISGASHKCQNNLCYLNTSGDSIPDSTSGSTVSHNYSGNPGFVGSETGDFNLSLIGSPANGYGTPIVGISLDFYGRTRPNPPSAGAAEFGTVTTPSASFWELVLLKIFRNEDFTVTAIHVSLHTGDPGLTGANEMTGLWYSRQSVSHSGWSAASGRRISNNSVITWSATVAGTVTHVGFRTAAGVFIKGAPLVAPKSFAIGSAISFQPDVLVCDLGYGYVTPAGTSGMSTYLANKILDYVFRGGSVTSAPVRVSLHTAAPGLTGANEASGGSYARQIAAIVDWPTDALDLDSGFLINLRFNGTLTFTNVPAGRYSYIGLWDGSGNFLMDGFLWADDNGAQKYIDVVSGDSVVIAADLNGSVVLNA